MWSGAQVIASTSGQPYAKYTCRSGRPGRSTVTVVQYAVVAPPSPRYSRTSQAPAVHDVSCVSIAGFPPAGFRLVLDGVGLERDALAVRVATRMGEDDLTYVGCRFTSPLTVAEQRRIGLLDEQRPLVTPEWTEPVLLEALPLLVRKGVCVDVFAFGGERLAGPTFVGRLVGMGGTALCVASYIARDRGVFETVGDAPLRIELRRNGVELWTTQARPAAVRPGAEPLDPVEIGLVAEQTPPLAIRELLVPRR